MSNKIIPKKAQHFIPQGYLRKFSIAREKSVIWKYDKLNGSISERPVSIRKVCFRDFYYYQKDDSGKIDHTSLEDGFSKIENAGIKIINKLSTKSSPSKLIITGEEHGQLAFFIALMLTRNPAFRDGINQSYGWLVQHTHHTLSEKGKLPEPPEELKDLIAQKGIDSIIKIDVSSQVSLGPMIETARALALTMLKKIWIFYIPYNTKSFVTSDNPVSYGFIEELPNTSMGPLHPYAEITVPLRKDLALTVAPSVGLLKEQAKEFQYLCFKATEQDMATINRRTAAVALQYVYSPENSKELLDLVKSVKNENQRLVIDGDGERRFSIIENPYSDPENLT